MPKSFHRLSRHTDGNERPRNPPLAQKPHSAHGQNKAIKVLQVVFPTDYLSTPFAPPKKKTRWIAPAPPMMSVILECYFTNDTGAAVRSAISPARSMLMYVKLPNGEAFCATAFHSEFAGNDFSVPASHGHKEDFVFLREDPEAQGRPIRLAMFDSPKDGDAMFVWEYGGVKRPNANYNGATLTRNVILDGTDWGRSS